MTEKKKSRFKMPSSYTTLFIIIIAIAILTWIIPAGMYEVDADGNVISGTYHLIEKNQQGFWDVMAAPIIGMIGNALTSGAIEISIFILIIGGFLNVITRTGAIDAGIGATIRSNRDNMTRMIWILMFIFALGGSTYGMAEETIPFYAILLPLMINVGFDSVVAMATVLVGSGMGVLASTFNPFATGVASSMAGISMADGLLPRLVMWVVMYLIGGFYVTRYAKKVQEDDKNSVVYENLEEDRQKHKLEDDLPELTSKQKTVLMLFALTFVIMILGLVPWSEFGITIFEDFHAAITSNSTVAAILGQSLLPFGQWYLIEISVLFLLMSIVIAMVYGLGEENFIEAFFDGAKDLLGVALVVAVARGIQVVMNDGYITHTILYWGEQALQGLSEGLFITLTYLFYIPMSFLIPSTSGLASATMGIMAPLGNFAGVAESLVITAYQAASGIVNLVTPTSGVVMGGLAICGISLGKWWKFMSKLLVITAIATIVILVFFAMIA